MNEQPIHAFRWRWWWPVGLMMAFIFFGSTDVGAAAHQSRLLGPFLHWLGLGDAAIRQIIVALRKLGHLTEYGVLAILTWRAWMRRPLFRSPAPWTWREGVAPFLICVAYASLDEFHQWFVPSRDASVVDIMIDAVSALIGLGLLWGWHHRRLGRTGAPPS